MFCTQGLGFLVGELTFWLPVSKSSYFFGRLPNVWRRTLCFSTDGKRKWVVFSCCCCIWADEKIWGDCQPLSIQTFKYSFCMQPLVFLISSIQYTTEEACSLMLEGWRLPGCWGMVGGEGLAVTKKDFQPFFCCFLGSSSLSLLVLSALSGSVQGNGPFAVVSFLAWPWGWNLSDLLSQVFFFTFLKKWEKSLSTDIPSYCPMPSRFKFLKHFTFL